MRWVECIRAIQARGVAAILECGPGKVLAGLTKRIDASIPAGAVFDPASINEAKAQLQ